MRNALSLFFAFVLCSLVSCSASAQSASAEANGGNVTVYYFHGKQRCATCIAIEKVAKETTEDIALPDVSFSAVDISTSDGEALADNFRVSSSALLVVKGGSVKNLTQDAFMNALRSPETLRSRITDAINQLAK